MSMCLSVVEFDSVNFGECSHSCLVTMRCDLVLVILPVDVYGTNASVQTLYRDSVPGLCRSPSLNQQLLLMWRCFCFVTRRWHCASSACKMWKLLALFSSLIISTSTAVWIIDRSRSAGADFCTLCTLAGQLSLSSLPPGSVHEDQLWLGRQRQVWFISFVYRCLDVQVKLRDLSTMSAFEMKFIKRGYIKCTSTFTLESAVYLW